MVRKYLYGGPGYFLGGVTAKDLDKGTKKVAKGFNWLTGKIGDIFNTVVTAGASSDFGQTSPFALMDRKTIAKGREQVRQKAKKALEENAVYVSPSSHVAAWIQGSWNPKVGALFLASDPRIQALGAIGDLVTLKYAPKAVKVGKNLSLILKKRSVISKVNKELKKGIKENSVLESYNEVPANKDIGTAYDYLDFLDNIYPNSKLNATFYHGGPKGITQFKTAKELGSTNKGINSGTKDYGIYLADDKSLALYYAETNKKNNRHLYNVRVNVQNPMRYETNNWYMDKMSTTGDLRFRPGEITLKWYDRLNLKNYDGIYHTKSKNAFDNGELVMFDKNNIHIMGTPEESLMFRNWKLNPLYSSKPLLEEIPLTPEQYERSFLNYAKAAKPGLFFAGLASTPPALIWYDNYKKSKTANARKWKHLLGGMLNLLQKFLEGGKTKNSFWKNAGNFLVNSGLGNALIEGGLGLLLSSSQNKSIAGATDIAKSEIDMEEQEAKQLAMLKAKLDALNMLLLDPNNPNAFGGNIFLNYILLLLYNEHLDYIKKNANNRKKLIDVLSLKMQGENTSNALSNILGLGTNALMNYLGNKVSNKTTTTNNSGGGWTMNYNSLYGNKSNYNNFLLTGSLPKMNSVVASNTSWLNNNPLST